MAQINKTVVEEFIFTAFADLHRIQILIFLFFLLTYITCVMGNLAIIIVVKIEPSLHNPMYFFITILSTLEIMLVSVIVPKLLAILVGHNTISFIGCFTQMYTISSLGVTEFYLLAVMVFDRHLAINKPLHYTTIMTNTLFFRLAIFPWIFGFTSILIQTIIMAQLEFCGPNIIDHYFCDFAPLQSLACSDPSFSIMFTAFAAGVDVLPPFLTIIGFYICIIVTVSKIKSKDGKQKAFSTCTSHLTVTSLFYGTIIIIYVKPDASYVNDKYLSVMCTAFTPTLNPFIYTLRNREVKNALWNLVKRVIICHVKCLHLS